MSASQPLPGYRLILPSATAPARVERIGPREITRVGIGRTPSEVARLASLLFPICGVAQSAAALRAAEAASGISLAPGQAAARDTLVLAEAVSGCIWRSALSWPALLGAPPLPTPVQAARTALAQLTAAIFTGPALRLGGADIQPETQDLNAIIAPLHAALDTLRPIRDQILDVAPGAPRFTLPAPLGDGLLEATLAPGAAAHEETPRALHTAGQAPASLVDWFAAHWAHGEALLSALETTAATVQADAPTPAAAATTGTGLGIAMTARGRLRHAITVENGVVTDWRVAAPTDWNLAPGGLLETLANQSDAASDPRWLIAAADPCAPCTPTTAREAAHA